MILQHLLLNLVVVFFIAQTYFIVKNRMIVKRSGNDPKGLGQEEEIFSV